MSMTTLTYNEYVVPRGEAITLDIPQRFPKWAGQPIGENHLVGFMLQWHFGVPFEVSYVFDQATIQNKVRVFRDALAYAINRTGNLDDIRQRLVREAMLVLETITLTLRHDTHGVTELKYITNENNFVIVTSTLVRIQLPLNSGPRLLEWISHFLPLGT